MYMIQLCHPQYEHALQQQNESALVVWGMGGRYQSMKHMFANKRIVAFATNDASLHGTTHEDCPVIGLEDLQNYENCVVCICSYAEKSIRQSILNRYGAQFTVLTLYSYASLCVPPNGAYFIHPEQTPPLNNEALAKAREICSNLGTLLPARESVLQQGNMDAEIAIGQANWAVASANDYMCKYERIVRGNATDLAFLRAFTAHFTGNVLYGQINTNEYQSSFTNLTQEYLHKLTQQRSNEILALLPSWQSIAENIPPKWHFRAPAVLGEMGWMLDDCIVNMDTLGYMERASILYHSGILSHLEQAYQRQGRIRILEIGAGYGALAHWLLDLFPRCEYTIIDLPESLLFSHLYLSLSRPNLPTCTNASTPLDYGVRFVPNWQAEQFLTPQTLIINTLSLSEMNEKQVRLYAELAQGHWLADKGLFFEQNQDNTSVGFLCAQDILGQYYPYRRRIAHGHHMNGYANVWAMHPFTGAEHCETVR